jgi:uncharacterized membrane protein
MSTRTRAALLGVFVGLLFVGPAVGGAVAPAPTGGSAAGADATQLTSQQSLAPDNETLRIGLQSDGNARWTIRSNYSLATDADERAFRALAADYTDGNYGAGRVAAFRTASQRASEATGRSMVIRNVKRSANVTNGTGQLVLQFTWTNFSRQSGERLYADDVFNTSGQTWLPGLEPYQRLVIEPPPAHTIVRATPAGYTVSDGTVRWEGPREFAPGDLSASYQRVENSGPGFPVALAGLLVGAVAVVAVVGYLVRARDGLPVPPLPTSTSGDESGETAVTDGASAESADAAVAAGATGDTDEGDAVDAELLSDEERIERLLERNGGRMKQATIVKETDWSNAKVSQLLSAMDDEGRIDKLRIGRENLISFPDEDVTDLDDE